MATTDLETKATLSPRDLFKLEPLTVLVTTNPKKPGSMSYERFEGYFSLEGEVTVQDALDAGLRMDDIRHDSAHGFIHIGEGAIAGRQATAADFGL